MQTSIVATRRLMRGGRSDVASRVAVVAHGWSTVAAALAGPWTVIALVLLATGEVALDGTARSGVVYGLHLVVIAAGVAAFVWPIAIGAAGCGSG